MAKQLLQVLGHPSVGDLKTIIKTNVIQDNLQVQFETDGTYLWA